MIAASAALVQFARRDRLIWGELVAIDGTKTHAVASKKAERHKVNLQRTHKTITQEINQYLSQLDSAEQNESGVDANRSSVLVALPRLQQRQCELNDEIKRMEGSRSTLSVQGKPEARGMKSLDSAPGYYLQTAVDAHSHLIVHHTVCK